MTDPKDGDILIEWGKDFFLFGFEGLGMKPSEPIDALRGKDFEINDAYGNKRTVRLFDEDGTLVYHDLQFYKISMFKNQSRSEFKKYNGTRFTWQQTVIFTAYQRALDTFGKDSFNVALRWITVVSGRGIGKTAAEAAIAIHFLICFFGSNIAMTANTDKQINDVFMKEVSIWIKKLPPGIAANLVQTSDHIRIEEEKDWFLRASVARPENPEALSGLHSEHMAIIADEVSGIMSDRVFEMMAGSLTGENYVVLYFSNGTRTEGEFYRSHQPGAMFTQLSFSSRQSPIVQEGMIEKFESDYPPIAGIVSDQVRVHIDGGFPAHEGMDDGGWIPLLQNVNVLFEPEHNQIINHPIVGVDPSGSGKDHTAIVVRDNVYMKMALYEAVTGGKKDGARKVEAIRDAYNASSNDVGIDAFGIGAEWVGEINTKMNENINAILTDKPREEVKDLYNTFNDELGWKFRSWLVQGGIIVTNKPAEWMKELNLIKYKRVGGGKIKFMPKEIFKKLNGFSPDRFDAGKLTFFRDEPTMPVILTKVQLENKEMMAFIKQNQKKPTDNFSSMG